MARPAPWPERRDQAHVPQTGYAKLPPTPPRLSRAIETRWSSRTGSRVTGEHQDRQDSQESEPGRARIGTSEFDWPIPDRRVAVGDRHISVELLVVAGLYAIAGLWLTWSIRDVIGFLPEALSGLFSSSFEFAFSWLVLAIVGMVGYCIVALLYTAWRIFLCDPVGRGLSVVIAAILVLLCFAIGSQGVAVPGSVILVALVACACSALMFVSPWARRAMATSKRRLDRPTPVVVSLTVTVSFFSLVGVLGLLMLPGLRFAGDLGVRFVLFELFSLTACALALCGYVMLRPGPNREGRLALSAAGGLVLFGYLLSGQGSSIALGLGVATAVVAPLWLVPSARVWFGDKPLDLTSGTGSGPTAGPSA